MSNGDLILKESAIKMLQKMIDNRPRGDDKRYEETIDHCFRVAIELVSAVPSAEATCDEWDGDGCRREVWEYDGFGYFGETEPSKRKLCSTCKHRTPYIAYDTCDIDGHVMGQFEVLKRCCDRWEKDEGEKCHERHDI